MSRTPSAAAPAPSVRSRTTSTVNDGEIIENHPNDRFVLHAHDKDGDYPNTFTLRPVGSTTEVTIRLEFVNMRGMAALLAPIVFPLVGKKDLRARMAMLKQKVEAGSSG